MPIGPKTSSLRQLSQCPTSSTSWVITYVAIKLVLSSPPGARHCARARIGQPIPRRLGRQSRHPRQTTIKLRFSTTGRLRQQLMRATRCRHCAAGLARPVKPALRCNLEAQARPTPTEVVMGRPQGSVRGICCCSRATGVCACRPSQKRRVHQHKRRHSCQWIEDHQRRCELQASRRSDDRPDDVRSARQREALWILLCHGSALYVHSTSSGYKSRMTTVTLSGRFASPSASKAR